MSSGANEVKEINDTNETYVTIYRGMGGRAVERVVRADGMTGIRKAYAADSLEPWLHREVLPELGLSCYPRLLGIEEEAAENKPGWLLFEDLGELDHSWEERRLLRLMSELARLHTLRPSMWEQLPKRGLKPSFAEMALDLIVSSEQMNEVCLLAERHGVPYRQTAAFLQQVKTRAKGPEALALEAKDVLGGLGVLKVDNSVLVHGDLHAGNSCEIDGRLVLIDWEHLHRGCRFWDLYHALDLTHPVYARPEQANNARFRLLSAYQKSCLQAGIDLPDCFQEAYCIRAAVGTLWLLLRIVKDQASSSTSWSGEQLARQLTETGRVLVSLFMSEGMLLKT